MLPGSIYASMIVSAHYLHYHNIIENKLQTKIHTQKGNLIDHIKNMYKKCTYILRYCMVKLVNRIWLSNYNKKKETKYIGEVSDCYICTSTSIRSTNKKNKYPILI